MRNGMAGGKPKGASKLPTGTNVGNTPPAQPRQGDNPKKREFHDTDPNLLPSPNGNRTLRQAATPSTDRVDISRGTTGRRDKGLPVSVSQAEMAFNGALEAASAMRTNREDSVMKEAFNMQMSKLQQWDPNLHASALGIHKAEEHLAVKPDDARMAGLRDQMQALAKARLNHHRQLRGNR